jgi:hypothetical protein
MGGMTKAVEQRPAEAAHRGSRRAAAGADRPGRGGHRRRQQVPLADEPQIDILDIDNDKVREARSRG